ncbi:bifunctional UDP-sugar hydrolase/5'-nucleotidase [Agrococcus versicolor]|uniref:Bifunctional UDP-sugar hydrolase/5'-nucleotidase n=1 Tax=Agrococcus versicolor TaxID=501482 RepID=A0ABP5MCA0_9MICO
MHRSNVRRGAVSAVAAAGAVALGLGLAAPASATVDPVTGVATLDLLAITDFHGALLTAPNIAQQVATIRAANEDTIFASVGDSIGGSTFESAVAQDQPTLDLLDEAGLDVSAVGNHEFDQGFADLRDRVQPAVDFDYLGANVLDAATGEPVLPPFQIFQTPSGVSVAYVGTVTETTPTIVSPAGIAGLEFADPVATTNEYAALLSDGVDTMESPEADVVVALVHEGSDVVAPGLSADVDVVFTGHSHETIVAATPSGAPVVQAGASGSALARVILTVDAEGDILSSAPSNLPVVPMTAAQAASAEPLDPAIYDPESVTIVRSAYADAAVRGNEVVGYVGAPFNAASNTGTANAGTPQHRGAESPIGNLIAEIALATVNDFGLDADFGIMNPGGIRADLDPNADGVVSFREAFNVTSFSNTIGTVDLTGAQVDTLLEQQFVARPPRPMLALGLSPELSYIYDPYAEQGSRVDDIFLDGAPIDAAATYRVASNTFLLEGADGFTVLGEGTNLQESGVVDWQATANFLEGTTSEQPLLPSYRQQSVGVTPVTDLDQVFAPGDEITIDLSSLSFTSTEPKPTDVTAFVVGSNLPEATSDVATADAELVQPAALPGTVLAEVQVDNTNVLDSNETGRASVTVTIPEDTVDGQLTLAYAWSGPELLPDGITLSVTVAADVVVPPSEEPAPSTPPSATPPVSAPPVAGGVGGGQGTLPQTGSELVGPAILVAILALLAGLGLVVRRRRTA